MICSRSADLVTGPVGVVVIARKLTHGNSVAIPAIAETKNTRRCRDYSWLGDLNSNQD
jgi:hypothetical protein